MENPAEACNGITVFASAWFVCQKVLTLPHEKNVLQTHADYENWHSDDNSPQFTGSTLGECEASARFLIDRFFPQRIGKGEILINGGLQQAIIGN